MHIRDKRIYRVTLTGSIVNVVLLVLKFVAGIIGNSAAMVADAVHSLSDFLTDIVVLAFVKLSSKPADSDHDYGHGKYETVATSIIGMALVVVAVMLGWDGAEKIIGAIKGEKLESPGWIAFAAAILSIALKEWVFRITKKVAKEVNSQALEANAWHHRSDAMSSIGTAIGIGGAVLLGNDWAILDPIAAIVVSILICVAAYRLLRQASGELLEESLPKETQEKIKQIVYQDELVSDIHRLHTRRIGSIVAIEMHLRLPGAISLTEAHAHATDIEKLLRKEFGKGTHIMLHIEPVKVPHNTETNK
ncbi:MAG: cation diffusion facilitator family transporter [Bacteroidales bacterium]|nr:cation diffusion facilitator family transporter [Bacteroidales bacterium]